MMTPTQRAAAERLSNERTRVGGQLWGAEVVALLRELLAEPVINHKMTTEPAEPQGEPAAWIQPDHLQKARVAPFLCRVEPTKRMSDFVPLYAHPPQQRKPLTRSMQAEIECDCLVAWNASTYGHSKQDTVHPMFLSAFILGYWTAERAHGITGEPT